MAGRGGRDRGIQVGQPLGPAGTLHVAGALSLDATSAFQSWFVKAGTNAGSDYSQLTASGNVSLGGASLLLFGEAFSGSTTCLALNAGDVYTLLSTTGSVAGTFAGVPDGRTVSIDCAGTGTAPTVRINYTANAVTATVLTSGSGGSGGGGGGTLNITTSSLPAATIGHGYSATLAASGGAPTYGWSIPSGAIPGDRTILSSGSTCPLGGDPTSGDPKVTRNKSEANGLTLTFVASTVSCIAPPRALHSCRRGHLPMRRSRGSLCPRVERTSA